MKFNEFQISPDFQVFKGLHDEYVMFRNRIIMSRFKTTWQCGCGMHVIHTPQHVKLHSKRSGLGLEKVIWSIIHL